MADKEKHCGNCANHKKETYQLSDECGKCVAAILENGERTDPSHWREQPKTNAGRIRAMSDEELAEDYCKFLNAMLSKVVSKYKLDFEYDMEKGKSIMLKYLQQPAEGE